MAGSGRATMMRVSSAAVALGDCGCSQVTVDNCSDCCFVFPAVKGSIFFRDCVQGNCFPIDRRVANKLKQFGLPEDETRLVVLCLETGRNPRLLARLFYQALNRE